MANETRSGSGCFFFLSAVTEIALVKFEMGMVGTGWRMGNRGQATWNPQRGVS